MSPPAGSDIPTRCKLGSIQATGPLVVLAIADHAAEEMINAGTRVFLKALNFTCVAFEMLGPVEAPFTSQGLVS